MARRQAARRGAAPSGSVRVARAARRRRRARGAPGDGRPHPSSGSAGQRGRLSVGGEAGQRRDLFGAAGVMMAAFLLSRATGLLRTIAVGYQFGTLREYDAYLAGNRL